MWAPSGNNTIVKYDDTTLPTGYDRARTRSPEVLGQWMTLVRAHTPACASIQTIVDLGCGTGRFSGPLGSHFQATVVGIDPSVNMIRQAIQKHDAPFQQFVLGAGEHIPLRDESVDLVFMSMVIHHFNDLDNVLKACHRILNPSGFVFLRSGTTDRIASYPAAQFFPSSVPIMERTLSSVNTIRTSFERAGFHTIDAGLLEQEIAATHTEYIAQLKAGGDSVLAQLSRMDFEDGVKAVLAVALAADPLPVREPLDFFVFHKTLP